MIEGRSMLKSRMCIDVASTCTRSGVVARGSTGTFVMADSKIDCSRGCRCLPLSQLGCQPNPGKGRRSHGAVWCTRSHDERVGAPAHADPRNRTHLRELCTVTAHSITISL